MPKTELEETGSKVSRRTFLKGMGSGIVSTTALSTGVLVNKEVVAAILKSGADRIGEAVSIQLNVNGKKRSVRVEPRTTLLSVLRDRMDLTGSKEVCDRGQCGACTVMIDNKTVLSCMMLALDARNKQIKTVEGLADGDNLSTVQQAFVEKDALMCGFCTPGLVMSATALLHDNPSPDLDEIKLGLSGNLCRCGTYHKLFEAVQSAVKITRKGG